MGRTPHLCLESLPVEGISPRERPIVAGDQTGPPKP